MILFLIFSDWYNRQCFNDNEWPQFKAVVTTRRRIWYGSVKKTGKQVGRKSSCPNGTPKRRNRRRITPITYAGIWDCAFGAYMAWRWFEKDEFVWMHNLGLHRLFHLEAFSRGWYRSWAGKQVAGWVIIACSNLVALIGRFGILLH
jgi:hypothetical protein